MPHGKYYTNITHSELHKLHKCTLHRRPFQTWTWGDSYHGQSPLIYLKSLSQQLAMVQRRIFIGPMPEKVVAQIEATQHKRSQLNIESVFSLIQEQPDNTHNIDKIEEVSRIVKEHPLHFFLHEGGRAKDWNAEEEQHITDELAKRWKSSEWGQLWTRRYHRKKEPQSTGDHHWFGTSFEVGTLMGVNVLRGKEHITNMAARCNPARDKIDDSSSNFLGADTSQRCVASTDAPSTSRVSGDALDPTLSVEMAMETPPTSRTSLLPPRNSDNMSLKGEGLSLSNDREIRSTNISRDFAQPLFNGKGKGKAVRYSDHSDLGLSTPSPVPPEELLKRSTVDSSASSAFSIAAQGPTWGDVILQGVYN